MFLLTAAALIPGCKQIVVVLVVVGDRSLFSVRVAGALSQRSKIWVCNCAIGVEARPIRTGMNKLDTCRLQ